MRSIPNIVHFSLPNNPSAAQKRAVDIATRLHPGWKIDVHYDDEKPENRILSDYYAKACSGAQRADFNG